MVYLDYAATTPVDKRVLESFERTCIEYVANPNSLHSEGVKAKKLMEAAVNQVASLLNVRDDEVIFTSGATESNNLAIMGVINKYKTRGKTIITTKLEHSSILETVGYLEKNGYTIKYVKLNEFGLVDIDNLKELLNDDVVLVSVCEVNSEIGIMENIKEVGELLSTYPRIIFHVDGTGAVGKKHVDLTNIDLYSFSGHKIYGLKGVGCLIKKEHITLEPLIHGGKSQSIYRGGTPSLPLIVSTSKALRLALTDLDKKYDHVKELNLLLRDKLKNIDGVVINSNDCCIPHILNISIPGVKPETMLHALEEEDIYISTKTACSKDNSDSLTLTTLGYDHSISGYSLRISLSYLTTKEELDTHFKKLQDLFIYYNLLYYFKNKKLIK